MKFAIERHDSARNTLWPRFWAIPLLADATLAEAPKLGYGAVQAGLTLEQRQLKATQTWKLLRATFA